jgi:hypothetical protein
MGSGALKCVISQQGSWRRAPAWGAARGKCVNSVRGPVGHPEELMASFSIDDLAHRLLDAVPQGLRGLPQDLETNFRAVLRANLARLDLVARDEFDTQAKVLERTRARLTTLEKRLAELEARLPPHAG